MGRSETLFRKAEAIQGLCGARVALMVFDCDGGAVKTWPKEPEAVRATIEAYRMFVAKGKKRIRATVDPDPRRPSEGDFSFLDTAMAQKLQAIDSKIQTLTMSTMMSSSSSTIISSSSSDGFLLVGQSGLDFVDYEPPFESSLVAARPSPQESPADPPSFGGGCTTATTTTLSSDWFLEAAQSGLDFIDYADLPSFGTRLRESPVATSSSSAAAMHASESEIIVIDDDSEDEDFLDPQTIPLISGDNDDVYVGKNICAHVEEGEDLHIHVEEGGHLDSSIFKGLLDLSTAPLGNLEDYYHFCSSPGTYTDFALTC